jgi:Raf kinase inhibitor-like YbhB/YbcL family protein
MRGSWRGAWRGPWLLVALAACSNSPSPSPSQAVQAITVTSSAFGPGQPIPVQHTCSGAGTVPALSWSGVPAGAASVAVVMTDPDAPSGTFVHWIVTGLPADARQVPDPLPTGAQAGPNSAGSTGWRPPCPPKGGGTHHYVFEVLALSRPVAPTAGAAPLDVVTQLRAAALPGGRATYTGTFSRN